MKKELIDIISELEEYYECAGFADYYERVLKNMSEKELLQHYRETFEIQEDFEFEQWEQRHRGEMS